MPSEKPPVSTWAIQPAGVVIRTTTTGPDGRYVLPIADLPLTGMLVWCRADDYQAMLADSM